MGDQAHQRPGAVRRRALGYWIVPALVVVAAVLAVLALQIGARREPPSAQALTTAPPTAPAQPSPAPTGAALPPAAQPTPAPGALASADDVQRIDPAEAKALVDQGLAAIYDVRSQSSYDAGHAAGAILLPYDQVEAQASTLPKDKILVLYCT